MKIIGLTGGIGSGKTTVSKYFEELGVPVYEADHEAKGLMNRSKILKRKLTALFGDKAYTNGTLNRPFLADKIFNDKELLSQMNAIVHPKVAAHFKRWLKKQNAPYIIKEVAIIFENNLQNQYDLIILVVTDKEERIKRVMQRDSTSRDHIISVMNNQLSDEEKSKMADFVITNRDLEDTKRQVVEIHHKLLNK
ncbi:MAG: dephospho-CoA kinase [Winogradskyella sp.]|nr:dephospho-CoA kinase [Winogradskyella sp.]